MNVIAIILGGLMLLLAFVYFATVGILMIGLIIEPFLPKRFKKETDRKIVYHYNDGLGPAT
jgi:hypothetical protein